MPAIEPSPTAPSAAPDFIQALYDDLIAAEAGRGRSAQVETGASQAHGCRAEAVLRLNRVPQSDPRLSWDAWVGNAIHERLARLLAAEGRLIEQQYAYRGVKATIDRADTLGLFAGTLTDYKSKGSGGDIAAIRRDGPRYDAIAQIHLGAAALIDAGHDVTHVQLCFVPRDGDLLRDGYVWGPQPFDRAIADKAVEAVEESNALAVEREGVEPLAMVEGLRDSNWSFCRQYCEYVTTCRGPAPEDAPLDEGDLVVAAEWEVADALQREGEARKKRAEAFLRGKNGTVGPYRVSTSGGYDRFVEKPDVEAALDLLRFYDNDVPTKEVHEVRKASVRVVRAEGSA